jgi:DNA gyrase subunit A
MARGMAIVNLLELGGGETVAAMLPVKMNGRAEIVESAVVSSGVTPGYETSGGFDAELLDDSEGDGDDVYKAELLDNGDDIYKAELLEDGDGVYKSESLDETDDGRPAQYLIMVTKRGVVKRTRLSEFDNIKKGGKVALNIREGDELITVLPSDGRCELFLATESGMGIRFPETDVRPMGRTASGVKGMSVKEGDHIVGASAADGFVLFVTENGYGKCTPVSECRNQHRGGSGIIIYKPNERTGPVMDVCAVTQADEVMLINSDGVIIRIRVADISVQGRYAQGVKLINMGEGVTVKGVAKIKDGAVNGDDPEDEAADEEPDAETISETDELLS